LGIDLRREPVPDGTTVCKFRHLLEQQGLGERLFERVGEHLQQKGLRLSTGTIRGCDDYQRSEFDQERAAGAGSGDAPDAQGQAVYFGMKAHVGVDSQTKLIHSVVATFSASSVEFGRTTFRRHTRTMP
jgi:transposase, IS5 family